MSRAGQARIERGLALALFGSFAAFGSTACKARRDAEPPTPTMTGLAAGTTKVVIEPAPEYLRGRVALPAGARLYSRPTFASASWTLTLPDPPLVSGSEIPRAKALRVVGIVHPSDGTLGGAGDFVALTNDLVGEGEAVGGCGPGFDELRHLRMLVYVPIVHLAEVTTRALEFEGLALAAGVRVGPVHEVAGFPPTEENVHWRSIDADGIRTHAPIPDDAVGLAWDPSLAPEFSTAGEALFRDAEGSTLWLRDDGGGEVEARLGNPCGEQTERVVEPERVESLRALALDAFYDQRPASDPEPVVEAQADYKIPAGTPLRWPDGDLAGETLADWSVAIGVGQTWDGRRCFTLALGPELVPVDAPALVCVDPGALILLTGEGTRFGVSDELDVGGSIELGPAVALDGGPWDPQALRAMLNGHHESVGECLRPLLGREQGLVGARWDLRIRADAGGRVDEVEVVPRGPTLVAVEDCLKAEAFTWWLPSGVAGTVEVPVTVAGWTPEPDPADPAGAAGTPEPEPERKPKSKPKSGREAAVPPQPERGKVVIIRDDDEPEPEPETEPE